MHIITADLIFRVSDLRSYTSCKNIWNILSWV